MTSDKNSPGSVQPWLAPEKLELAQWLAHSHQQWTGHALQPGVALDDRVAFANALYHAPFAALAHGTEADPILSYANATTLKLWEYSWDELLRIPSRLTAEPMEQAARAAFLDAVRTKGFVDDYRGVRISKSGKRFWIENVTVWNLVDAQGQRRGQAAAFKAWKFLE